MASEATPLLGGDGGDASAAVGLPPVLKAMVGLDGPVYVGSEVASRLSFSSLIDLLPATENVVIRGTDMRKPLTHARLAEFIQKDFDLTPWGIGVGDRVAIVLPNGPEAAVCVLSVAAHCTCAPINHQNTHDEIEEEMKNVGSKLVLMMQGVDNAHVEKAANAIGLPIVQLVADEEVSGVFKLEGTPTGAPSEKNYSGKRDVALVLHTSGTSGKKKVVPYTLEGLVVGAACVIGSWGLTPDDVNMNMMPLFHVGGIARNLFGPTLSGGCLVCAPGFDPIMWWDIAETVGVTWYYASPTMHQMILRTGAERKAERLSEGGEPPKCGLRMIANAAGGLLPSLAEQLKETFSSESAACIILPSYGMTECMPISTPPRTYKLDRPGTSGVAVGPEMAIGTPEGTMLPTGETGNIMVRGPPTMEGYEADGGKPNEKANAEVFKPGGWFDTGDMGYMDADGYLFITGRSKEVINRGGEIISPFEVEEALLAHPDVKNVISFSAPHDSLQEVVGAVIVTEDGRPRPGLVALQKWSADRLHPAKWPQVVVYMNDVPKNATNKVQRIKFAERCAMADVTDALPMAERHFEAPCPEKGVALSTKIPMSKIRPAEGAKEAEAALVAASPDAISDVAVVMRAVAGEPVLVAYVAPPAGVTPDALETEPLLAAVADSLHGYLLPKFCVAVDQIARTGAGKPDVDQLPMPDTANKDYVAPRGFLEEQIADVWQKVLDSEAPISVEADFFEVGGNSLMAGKLIASMRKRLKVPLSVAVIFSHRSVADMAELIRPQVDEEKLRAELSAPEVKKTGPSCFPKRDSGASAASSSLPVLLCQLLPVCVILPVRRIMTWLCYAYLWMRFMQHGLTRFVALLCSLAFTKCIASLAFPLLAIALKWLIVYKYQAGRYPLWGWYYCRWWVMDKTLLILGRGVFRSSSNMLKLYYQMMGAQIGRRVQIAKTAEIAEYDLLVIDDDTVLDACWCRPFCLDQGEMVLEKIHIGRHCAIGAKSSVAPGAIVPPGTCIGPLSSSYEMHDSVRANRDTCRPAFRGPHWALVTFVGYPIMFLVTCIPLLPWIGNLFLMVNTAMADNWFEEINKLYDLLVWFTTPERIGFHILGKVIRGTVSPILYLSCCVLTKWCVIGKFTPGLRNRSEWNIFKHWLMSQLMPGKDLGGVTHLVGTHYDVVSWVYRMLGASIGARVYWPGSGLETCEFDLLTVGDDVTFGSRSIFMCTDAKDQAPISIGAGAMIADRCVVLPGVTVERNAVLGSGGLGKKGFTYTAGSVWVGSRHNNAVQLEKGDRELALAEPTIRPFGEAFYGYTRVPYFMMPLWMHVFFNYFWSMFVTAWYAATVPYSLLLMVHGFGEESISELALTAWMILSYMIVFCSIVLISTLINIGAKWLVMGERKSGSQPWNSHSYCQRWQLYLTLEQIARRPKTGDLTGGGFMALFGGSWYLCWFFRRLGATIGTDVCLYPTSADPMMTEPDLVTLDDGACIDCASLICHINSRGAFGLNPLRVGPGACMRSTSRLLSGASMEANATLLEHTLVLGGDLVDENTIVQGWPANIVLNRDALDAAATTTQFKS